MMAHAEMTTQQKQQIRHRALGLCVSCKTPRVNATHCEKHRQSNLEMQRRQRNTPRALAAAVLSRALWRGELKRGNCEKCGKLGEAHHEDYSRPLEVRWLCPQHHLEVHGKRCFNPRVLMKKPPSHALEYTRIYHRRRKLLDAATRILSNR